MHLNSLFFATMAFLVSTVVADNQYALNDGANCLNVCWEEPGRCPPSMESTHLTGVCAGHKDLFWQNKRLILSCDLGLLDLLQHLLNRRYRIVNNFRHEHGYRPTRQLFILCD